MRPSNKYVFENERQQGICVNGSVELLREETVYRIFQLEKKVVVSDCIKLPPSRVRLMCSLSDYCKL